jgi:hypothetical protein
MAMTYPEFHAFLLGTVAGNQGGIRECYTQKCMHYCLAQLLATKMVPGNQYNSYIEQLTTNQSQSTKTNFPPPTLYIIVDHVVWVLGVFNKNFGGVLDRNMNVQRALNHIMKPFSLSQVALDQFVGARNIIYNIT